jgi:hypothetical protein
LDLSLPIMVLHGSSRDNDINGTDKEMCLSLSVVTRSAPGSHRY